MHAVSKIGKLALLLIVFINCYGCAVVGAGLLSNADQEQLIEYTAKNFGVEESRIRISDIDKEGNALTAGLAGRKIYYTVDLLPDPNGGQQSQHKRFRCQVLWHVFTKSPPVCSELGSPAVSVFPNVGSSSNTVSNSGPPQASRSVPTDAAGRAHIREIQSKLNALGYAAGVEDGIFGSKTAEALRSFQRNRGLPVSGTADRQTLAALGLTSPPQGP